MSTPAMSWSAMELWFILTAAALGLAAGWHVRRTVAAFPATFSGTPPHSPRPRAAPAVFELVTCALFVLLAWRFGPIAQLPAFLLFGATGVALAAIDLRHRLLPNKILGPATGLTALLLAGAAAAALQWGPLARAGTGALLLFLLYLTLALISPRSMGMGDVKLAALIGLVLAFQGWPTLFAGAFMGFLIGAALSLVVLLTRRGGLKSHIPFGPSMLAGSLMALLFF